MQTGFDPSNGFPLSSGERLFAKNTGILPGLLYFPAEDMPAEWQREGWRTEDVNGFSVYAVPEVKLFTTSASDAKLLSRHSVQLHLLSHNIQGVYLIHWLFCIRDRWPDPFMSEVTLNPSIHLPVLRALTSSPILIINAYHRGEYVETRFVDNPLRQAAAQALEVVAPAPQQESAVFMNAKARFEQQTQLQHRSFTWTEPVKATIARFRDPKRKKGRKSLNGIAHEERMYIGLPVELEPYHFWVADAGHSIMAVPKVLLAEAGGAALDDYEVPIPVKYVLERGYTIRNGYVIVDAPYDPVFGLEVEERYSEY